MNLSPSLHLQSTDGASAEIHAQGAHLSSWRSASGVEQLFLSTRSAFAPGVAIRGGIPVIFPQFAGEGPLPKHGFARSRLWTLLEQQADRARWSLESSAASLAIWPQAFRCELAIEIGGSQLQVELSVLNTGETPMQFTAALHTYLRVAAIDEVRVLGLQGLRYRDSAQGSAEFVELGEQLAIVGEVDRIYFDAPPQLELIQPSSRLLIGQRGFTDTVVWNPGAEKGAALADLEVDGYRRMLCIEAATVGRPVHLAPGERWAGSQTLRA
ncbi:MAG: D-hexose-6-phosphate mutarotase [Hydrocarboniphaga sp.]|uniref:D-hexose-6-phosphate mutarotase n=1 Tax=Hydrocarboniphaga sp. TaxID=2033016 RepID=UPI0026287497|nr:D-hexose-6-phosphate mutarotase [Hydrocarboniphaga sp.]MDB5970996.1 D-hexose-6-phosphate mutarotase [Hydrocarboniphaga sp.]